MFKYNTHLLGAYFLAKDFDNEIVLYYVFGVACYPYLYYSQQQSSQLMFASPVFVLREYSTGRQMATH